MHQRLGLADHLGIPICKCTEIPYMSSHTDNQYFTEGYQKYTDGISEVVQRRKSTRRRTKRKEKKWKEWHCGKSNWRSMNSRQKKKKMQNKNKQKINATLSRNCWLKLANSLIILTPPCWWMEKKKCIKQIRNVFIIFAKPPKHLSPKQHQVNE